MGRAETFKELRHLATDASVDGSVSSAATLALGGAARGGAADDTTHRDATAVVHDLPHQADSAPTRQRPLYLAALGNTGSSAAMSNISVRSRIPTCRCERKPSLRRFVQLPEAEEAIPAAHEQLTAVASAFTIPPRRYDKIGAAK